MGEDEMHEIAEIILATAHGETSGLRDRVKTLTEAYPLYE
jgi:glycine/serine hydroxymethyltransferase